MKALSAAGEAIDRARAIGIIRPGVGQPAPRQGRSAAMEPEETVDTEVLSCDGGGGSLGHPRVYLNMEGKGRIDCPYCGRRFVLNQAAGEKTAH
jgi:uncharacterized Zn-finger protein